MDQELPQTKSLGIEDVYNILESFVKDIMELSSTSFDEALWLCLIYKWNKRLFEESYYNLSDNQKQKDS